MSGFHALIVVRANYPPQKRGLLHGRRVSDSILTLFDQNKTSMCVPEVFPFPLDVDDVLDYSVFGCPHTWAGNR